MDLDYPDFYFPDLSSPFVSDPKEILTEILRLRDLFRSTDPEFRILFGLEFGMQPHLGSRFSDLASAWPLDFIIASQHLVGGLDPYNPEVWEVRTHAELIRSYYEEMLANLKIMPEWDTLGHLDYIIRYIPGRGNMVFDSCEAFPDLIDEILLFLIQSGKCLEVNAAGYKHNLGQPNPAPSILRRSEEPASRSALTLTLRETSHPALTGSGSCFSRWASGTTLCSEAGSRKNIRSETLTDKRLCVRFHTHEKRTPAPSRSGRSLIYLL